MLSMDQFKNAYACYQKKYEHDVMKATKKFGASVNNLLKRLSPEDLKKITKGAEDANSKKVAL